MKMKRQLLIFNIVQLVQMEAIYDAILLLSDYPVKATAALNSLSQSTPNFLQLLKEMTIQFYDRFRPSNRATELEYELLIKQILVIFNRYIMLHMKARGNNIYLQIQNLYQWLVAVLSHDKITINIKKVLEPSLSEIINNLCFKKERFMKVLDDTMDVKPEVRNCIFIYLNSLLSSKIYNSQKIATIQQSFTSLYYIINQDLERVIEFFNNCNMEIDSGYPQSQSRFASILKEHQYALQSLCKAINFLYNLLLSQKNKCKLDGLLSNMLLNVDLAKYINTVSHLEQFLANGEKSQNMFNLKIIIANNLRRQEKKVVNTIKTTCLTVLKLILSITDKKFNLKQTDKLLLRQLPSMTEVLAKEIIICSYQKVIATLGEQGAIMTTLESLYDLLSQLVLFYDLKPIFQSLTVEQVIRLTFRFMKTYEEEMDLFPEIQEYFTLIYYILYGFEDNCQKQQIDLGDPSSTNFCLKKQVVRLIKNMNEAIEGFHSIEMQICCDVVLLEMQLRKGGDRELKEMLLAKYRLQPDIFECLSLENSLFIITVLLDKYPDELEKAKKMRFILETIKLRVIDELEMCRLYTLLSVHAYFFTDRQLQLKYFHFIQWVLKMQRPFTSTGKQGFYFLERLVMCNKQYDQNYCVFVDKILNEAICWFEQTQCPYVFDFLLHVFNYEQVTSLVINQTWLNLLLERINKKLQREVQYKIFRHEVINVILSLCSKVIEVQSRITQGCNASQHPDEDEINYFHELINSILSGKMFVGLNGILAQKELINQEYTLIYNFGEFMFNLLIHDIRLKDQQFRLMTDYSMGLLARPEAQNKTYNLITFKLLYQVINRNPFNFQDWHYRLILNWMKQDIEKDEIDQIFLNRVCIILQQFYFFINANIFYREQMITFFEPITELIEKRFLTYLMDYQNYLSFIEQQVDPDIKKINLLNIDYNPITKKKKRNAVTIIRLYNTILLNPNFKPKSIHLIKDIMKYYIFEVIPAYDLSVQMIALKAMIEKSKNSGVVQCFRTSLQLLYYNSKHPTANQVETAEQQYIRNLTQQLCSQISSMDPYAELFKLVNGEIIRTREETVLIDYDVSLQQLEVDVIQFVKSDAHTLELVKKLSKIRRVNDQPRVIRKIKRQQQEEFRE